MKYKQYKGMKVMQGTKLYELLESGTQEDLKAAKRLAEFVDKAARCGYQLAEYTALREQYKDDAP